MSKALIAMSGGVDSSVASAIIKERGYDCIGVTMRLYNKSPENERDAGSVALSLGIPFSVCDLSKEFEHEVISRFISAYEGGMTPNPCVMCNRHLKFGELMRVMRESGCDCIVTGHYARIEFENGRYLLKKGLDVGKDQSYVLYSLTQDQLARTLLPLGDMPKSEVREYALSHGFITAEKRESQDICFVPDGDYARFICEFTGKSYPHGDFKDTDGRVLGEHRGIIHYTIGQRKGLGLALPAPLYVKCKDTESNTVVLSPESELYTDRLTACDFNWIAFEEPVSPFHASVRTRYNGRESGAIVTPLGNKRVEIVFDTPVRAITRGQSAVVYDGDTVIGGGIIE